MIETRKQEIIKDLMEVYNKYEVPEDLLEVTIFSLMSVYNRAGKNDELVGGDWIAENCPEPLKSLPI